MIPQPTHSGDPAIVEVEVADGALATVTLDGHPYAASRTLARADIGTVIDQIAQIAGTVRVRVTESDGSQFTDLVTAPVQPDLGDAEATRPRPRDPHASQQPERSNCGVAAEGFASYEPVFVAIVLAQAEADVDGRVSVPLPTALARLAARQVLVLAPESGNFTVVERP